MEQGYLERESDRMNKVVRKTLLKVTGVFLCAVAVIYFLGRDSIDFSDISYGSIPFILVILAGIVAVCLIVNFLATSRTAVNGSNLYLPYGDRTQEEAGKIIDREALEGKILVEEFIYEFKELKKAYGEKVVLTPSYLLLCGVKGVRNANITAIPRDKIYWICAQAGFKGGPFIVKLLIFTDTKIYGLTGTDIKHVEGIADKFYQYIPNIFSDYDPFVLSYKLEEIFKKNPAEFIAICEEEKNKSVLSGSIDSN